MRTLHDLYRPLGNTGIDVSPIGLGTVKIGRDKGVKYPEQFKIPTDQEVLALLQFAQDLGINTLDTAPAYGCSEQRLGKLLTNRQDWVLVSKAGEYFVDGVSHYDFSAASVESSVKQSLKRLCTDYIDVLLIHSDGNDLAIANDQELWAALGCLKQAGLIRSYGLSGKTVEGGIKALQSADCAMVTYNLNDQSERPVLEYAQAHHKGIFIKKALASGHICSTHSGSSVKDSFQMIYTAPAVSSVIVGTINPTHLQHNVQVAVDCIHNR